MTRTTNKITRSLAPALVIAALIAPTAGAYQDISFQDMRDVAELSAPASGRHDLLSQDALDAARSLPPDQLAAVAEGLRSGPDGGQADRLGAQHGDARSLRPECHRGPRALNRRERNQLGWLREHWPVHR